MVHAPQAPGLRKSQDFPRAPELGDGGDRSLHGDSEYTGMDRAWRTGQQRPSTAHWSSDSKIKSSFFFLFTSLSELFQNLT